MQAANGSQVKYITAITGASNVTTSGLTGASDFAGYEFATLIVSIASGGAAPGLKVAMHRSGTSDGTFAAFGASLPGITTGSLTYVRSFSLDSSATWYKVSYDNNVAQWIGSVIIALQNPRQAPVGTQDTGWNTTVYSDVLGG